MWHFMWGFFHLVKEHNVPEVLLHCRMRRVALWDHGSIIFQCVHRYSSTCDWLVPINPLKVDNVVRWKCIWYTWPIEHCSLAAQYSVGCQLTGNCGSLPLPTISRENLTAWSQPGKRWKFAVCVFGGNGVEPFLTWTSNLAVGFQLHAYGFHTRINNPGMMVHACNPSYVGGGGRRIIVWG
jgi:hypothetical protein